MVPENTDKSLLPHRKIKWDTLTFFLVVHVFGFLVAPFYLKAHGISPFILGLTVFYAIITGLGITVGYHRLFAHRSFGASRFVEWLVLFFGAAAFEMSAFRWASQHRDHHQFVDTDRDPYNIKKGFFYAHMGWMLFWEFPRQYSNVNDLEKNSMLVHQHRFYGVWAFGAGVILPILIGALIGQAWSAFLIAVCLRISFVYQATFCINSVCHQFGRTTYDIYTSAKDNWFVAFLTYGEGYHNFHHRFPSDYRNGVRWYDWDPSKWMIAILSKFGMTSGLQRTSPFKILHAKIRADHLRAQEAMKKIKVPNVHFSPQIQSFLNSIQQERQRLVGLLHRWEVELSRYKNLEQEGVEFSRQMMRRAMIRAKVARKRFQIGYDEWRESLEDIHSILSPVPAIAWE